MYLSREKQMVDTPGLEKFPIRNIFSCWLNINTVYIIIHP